MVEILSKKYVKALFESTNIEEVEKIAESLKDVALAFNLEKFKDIIESPWIEKERKVDFILNLTQNSDQKFKNFLNVLAIHDRFILIPHVYDELILGISKTKGCYSAKLISKDEIDAQTLNQLQESIGKKIGAQLNLEPELKEYDGVKVVVDGLGMEIGFSKTRLKKDMVEHILKAI